MAVTTDATRMVGFGDPDGADELPECKQECPVIKRIWRACCDIAAFGLVTRETGRTSNGRVP